MNLTCERCGITEDGKAFTCPKHFRILMEDSNLARFLKQ